MGEINSILAYIHSHLIFFIIIGCILVIFVPIIQVKCSRNIEKTQHSSIANEQRRTLVQIIALLGIAISFYTGINQVNFSYENASKQFEIANKQIENANKQLQISQKTLEQSIEANTTNNFYNAIDKLSDNNTSIRIGAIYSLKQIAIQNYNKVPEIINILLAYIDDHSKIGSIDKSKPYIKRLDIEESIKTLLSFPNNKIVYDLSNLDLSFLKLTNVDLSGINFSNSIINHSIISDSNLSRCNFSGSDLSDSLILHSTMSDVITSKTTIMKHVNFSNSYIQNVNFSYLDLSNSTFKNTDLSNSILNWTTLSYSNFCYVNLSSAQICCATIIGATLKETNLFNAKMMSSDLTGSYIAANLSNTIFGKESDIETTSAIQRKSWSQNNFDATSANHKIFIPTIIFNANLQNSYNLTQEQVNNTCGNIYTKLPTGLRPCVCSSSEISKILNQK